MKERYPVTLAGRQVGTVHIQQEGLYYRILCDCRLEGKDMYRLLATCGESMVDMGVLIPGEDGFVLNTRLPKKRIGSGDITFFLRSNQRDTEEKFVPLHQDEPFIYLTQLKNARLENRDGVLGIVLKIRSQ